MRKFLLCLIPTFVFGFYFDLPISARSLALGRTGQGLFNGAQAAFTNPGALYSAQKYELIFNYEMPYSLSDFKKFGVAFKYNIKRFSLGLALTRKALLNDYSESNIFLIFSSKLGFLSFGADVRDMMLSVSLEDGNYTKNALTLDAGMRADFGWLKIGISSNNILNPSISIFEKDFRAPKFLNAGITLVRPSNVFWLFGYTKRRGKEELRFGIESWFTRGFAARFGIDRKYITLGFGLKEKWWALDFGAEAHRFLGTTYIVGFRVFQP